MEGNTMCTDINSLAALDVSAVRQSVRTVASNKPSAPGHTDPAVNLLPLPPTVHTNWPRLPCLGAAQHVSGLTFLFKGTLAGKPCTILFDTGASFCFLDQRWLQRHYTELVRKEQAQTKALTDPVNLATANGGLVQAHYEFAGLAVIQQARINITAKVLSKTLNGIDFIIGMDCLKAIQADLKCGQEICEVQLQRRTVKLRPVQAKSGDGHMVSCSIEQFKEAGRAEVLSPNQAAKLLRQGAAR